jgi:hypothetical protein
VRDLPDRLADLEGLREEVQAPAPGRLSAPVGPLGQQFVSSGTERAVQAGEERPGIRRQDPINIGQGMTPFFLRYGL